MNIEFVALPSPIVAEIRSTRTDSYGNTVEQGSSDGDSYPCRHCLTEIPEGHGVLTLAHRPFQTKNPFAETGPIYLCADACERARPTIQLPAILRSDRYLVRGYSEDERIVYGSGRIVATDQIAGYVTELFSDPQVAFADVRSASNNCFLCRIRPAS